MSSIGVVSRDVEEDEEEVGRNVVSWELCGVIYGNGGRTATGGNATVVYLHTNLHLGATIREEEGDLEWQRGKLKPFISSRLPLSLTLSNLHSCHVLQNQGVFSCLLASCWGGSGGKEQTEGEERMSVRSITKEWRAGRKGEVRSKW